MKHRIFIAINLPQETKEKIIPFFKELKKLNKRWPIKWVRPGLWHLTLHFLGNIKEDQIKKIKKILKKETKDFGPLKLSLKDFGAFPNLSFPRVIFLKAKEEEGDLKNFVSRLTKILKKEGFSPDEKEWRPHITLARVKGKVHLKGIDHLIPKGFSFYVKSIDLMESRLLPQGPEYTVLESYKLKL